MNLVHIVVARALTLCRSLARSERGAVSVEYMMVFGVVTIGMTVALVKLGPNLLAAWGHTQTVLLAGKP